MTLTRELCEIITATRFETLGAKCVQRVKQAIKDGVAVGTAGSREQPIRLLTAHLKRLGGKPQSTVWGGGFKTSPVHAAYVNGAAAHVLDFEPMWLPPTHSVSPVVPAAFALAEARGLGGREIVTAVAKGMEIQGRVQFAANQFKPEALRFHPPGTAGVLGAAVTAGHLLGLDSDKLAHALGIAASRAGSLLANIGSMTKSTHCGHAAASGVDAALLASDGFTANPAVFEAPRGFIETFYPEEFDRDKLLAYGKPFRVVDPGLAIKLFPSQFATHWAITAALELHPRVIDPAKIARVSIRTPVMKYCDRPQTTNGHEGKFSFQYTAAVALLDGSVTIESFTDARRFRSDMVALLGKVELIQDPAISGEWLGMRVAIEVEMRDGTKLNTVCYGPRGAWGQSPLSSSAHEGKLRDCLGMVFDGRRVTRILGLLDGLERQTARGINAIVAMLGGKPQRPKPPRKRK
jgi:aconitate decarboxylase